MIEVSNAVPLYRRDALDTKGSVLVKNHWNCNDMVVFVIEDKEYTMVANDLMTAIENATNVNRY